MRLNYLPMLLACLTTATAAGCAQDEDFAIQCDNGYRLASAGEHKKAVPLLDACISSGKASPSVSRSAYSGRAWSHSNLGDAKSAVSDQENAFRLSQPVSYHEFINYASYLRAVGRYQDSLAPLMSAEAIDRTNGNVSMMTQYNLGWTLQELGKHEEAIAAFTRGIPAQPGYAFVYFRRGLSFEQTGQKEAARSDFEKVSRLVRPSEVKGISEMYLPKIREKLNEYGLALQFAS